MLDDSYHQLLVYCHQIMCVYYFFSSHKATGMLATLPKSNIALMPILETALHEI